MGVVELEPEPTTPPPAPPAPTPPAPPAPQAAASEPAASSIVLLVSDASSGPSAAPSQLPELANGLTDSVRLSTLVSAVVLAGPDETEAPEATDEGSRTAIDHALDHWSDSVASSQRAGLCAPLSSAGMVPLSNSCPSSQRESILTAGTQSSPTDDRAIMPPALPPPDTPLERHRRTHPEAQSDTERPAVAVAPATSTRDHGRRLSGGGAPGGSSAAAGLRIFAVSTSPLLLTAPVTFPTEPQPSVLPEGEPGVPPPASPG